MEGLHTAAQIYKAWRFLQMYRETMGIVKGIGIGMAAAGDVVGNVSSMMR